MVTISEKKPFLVNIGALPMYCEKMSMSSGTAISIKPTVTGVAVKTNRCIQPTQISFKGRIYDPERQWALATLINHLNGSENLEIIYKALRFVNCIITGYTVVDSNEEYLDLSVEVTTPSIAYYIGEVTQ